MVRASTKLEFAWGLATAMAEAIGDTIPSARQMLGELWSYGELARSAVQAALDHPGERDIRPWRPARATQCPDHAGSAPQRSRTSTGRSRWPPAVDAPHLRIATAFGWVVVGARGSK